MLIIDSLEKMNEKEIEFARYLVNKACNEKSNNQDNLAVLKNQLVVFFDKEEIVKQKEIKYSERPHAVEFEIVEPKEKTFDVMLEKMNRENARRGIRARRNFNRALIFTSDPDLEYTATQYNIKVIDLSVYEEMLKIEAKQKEQKENTKKDK